MLVLHFSQVWSLGGVARALEVGREAWGFSELGRKAGVPPRRGRRQTYEGLSTCSDVRLYLVTPLWLLPEPLPDLLRKVHFHGRL
jgi:hypothetical protein